MGIMLHIYVHMALTDILTSLLQAGLFYHRYNTWSKSAPGHMSMHYISPPGFHWLLTVTKTYKKEFYTVPATT